ncbi:hypothetical protein P10159_4263 [Citrobacter portucalensis]|nr:hypothetical protein P10159_4263 [Citrobacter portucalensis]
MMQRIQANVSDYAKGEKDIKKPEISAISGLISRCVAG